MKRSRNAKFLSLFIALLLTFTLISACGGTDKPITPVQPDVDDPTEPEEEKQLTFFGEEYTFIMEQVYIENFEDESRGEYESDYKIAKIKETEKALDCNLTFTGTAVTQQMLTDAVAGGNSYNFYYSPAHVAYNYAKAGILADWEELDAIDLNDTAKWGSPAFNGAVYYHGKPYGVCCVISRYWNPYPIFYGGCMVNRDLVTYFNAEDPIELYEQGQWTFDGFASRVSNYMQADPENPIYSVTYADGTMLARTAMMANGANAVVDKDGALTFGFDTPEAYYALDWLSGLVADTDAFKEDTTSLCPTFVNGNATFYFGMNSWRGVTTQQEGEIMMTMKNVHWIPMPAGPSGSGVHTYVGNGTGATSFINAVNSDDAAYIYNYLAEYPYGTDYAGFYQDSYFFSQESYDIYMNCINTAVYDYSNQLTDTAARINAAIKQILKGSKTPAEALGTLAEKANAELAES